MSRLWPAESSPPALRITKGIPRSLLLAGLLLSLFAFLSVHAVSADPTVTDQKVDAPSKLTVGDHFRYVVKLRADAGATVTLAPGGLPPTFALINPPSVSSRSLGGGQNEVTVSLDIAAFATGDLDLPVKLSFKGPGTASGEVAAPPVKVTVVSVLPADATGATATKDLKPQAEIGEAPAVSPWRYVAVAVVLVLLVAMAFMLQRRWARRRRLIAATAAVESEAEEAPLGPEDRARRVLDGAGDDFARDGDYVTYYTAIAGTLREYLTERFVFPAFAMTTTEMQDQMVRRGMDRWQARIVSGLLSQCDAVVYASYRPAAERADHDLTAAYEIIEMSRPGAEPEPESEPVPDFRPPTKRDPYPNPEEIEL